jgi:hypothetical protein
MKKIAIVLFAVISLTSCGGGEAKCEGSNCDSTAVVAPVADSLAPVADTLAVDTTAVVTPTVK